MQPPLLAAEPDLSESLEPLRARLQQAMAWCSPRADPNRPRDCLRSAELRPRVLQPSYRAAVHDVGVARELYLGRALGRIEMPAGRGRLLLFSPDEELSDGVAERESDGFFDLNNTPPWDTWAAFIEESGWSYLVAWVPPALVSLAQRGMDANPGRCIHWLADAEAPFARWLAASARLS
jgi:hypothetical protein